MKLIDYSARLRMHPNNKEVRDAYMKACYELYKSAGVDEFKLCELAEIEGVSVEIVKRYAREYIIDVLGMSVEEFYEQYIAPKKKASREKQDDRGLAFSNLMFELIKVSDREQIISLIDDYKRNGGYLHMKENVIPFVCRNFPDKKYLIEELNDKIDIYLVYANANKRIRLNEARQRIIAEEMEQLRNKYLVANVYVREFIDGNYLNVLEYCQSTKRTLGEFKGFVEIVKSYDKALYQQYLDKIEFNKNRAANSKLDQIKELINIIKTGVVDAEGNMRKFDIIDYCQFTDMDFDTLDKMSRACKLTWPDLKIIRHFIGTNEWKARTNDINVILDALQEIDCKRDANGRLIPGTGRIIDVTEKMQIIEFMKSVGVPVNSKNYHIAFRRYIAGNLFDNVNKENVLVRSKTK